MAYKFQFGNARMSGSLQQEGSINVEGLINVSGTQCIDGSRNASLGTVTAGGIIKTDDTTEATTTTDGSLQTDGGLSVAKSAVIGDDLDLLSNSAIFKVGSDQPFTLTHANANNTLLATADHRLAFGDAGEYITGDGTDLFIVSSADVKVTGDFCPSADDTYDLGTTALAWQDLHMEGDVLMQDAGKVSTAAGDLTLESAAAGVTLDAATTLKLDSDSGDISFEDGGTAQLALDMDGTAGEIIMQLKVDSDDFVFKQFDGTEVFRVEDDGSFDIAGGAGSSGVTVSAAGQLTADGRIIVDDATEASSTTDGSLQTDGGLSVVKDAVLGNDVKLLSDAAVLNFGADSDVNLTHVADTGLLLNSTMAIQFNDASQYIKASSAADLDIAATTDINIECTTLDVNAILDVEGNARLNGGVALGNASGDLIGFSGSAASSLVPDVDSTWDLGSNAKRWSTIYVDEIVGASVAWDVVICDANDTISASAELAVIRQGNGITVGLPPAVTGRNVRVKLSGGVGDVLIAPQSGEIIEGQGGSIRLESTGSAVTFCAMETDGWVIL